MGGAGGEALGDLHCFCLGSGEWVAVEEKGAQPPASGSASEEGKGRPSETGRAHV